MEVRGMCIRNIRFTFYFNKISLKLTQIHFCTKYFKYEIVYDMHD